MKCIVYAQKPSLVEINEELKSPHDIKTDRISSFVIVGCLIYYCIFFKIAPFKGKT